MSPNHEVTNQAPPLEGYNLIASARDAFSGVTDLEFEARRIVESLALTWAGALLARHGEQAVFEAFVASRLVESHSGLYGTLPTTVGVDDLIARAMPV